MVGVELREALGSSDGSIHGVQYFKVDKEKGVFVKPHRVIPEEAFAHSEEGEDQNSRTWNKLDSLNEQLSLQRYGVLRCILRLPCHSLASFFSPPFAPASGLEIPSRMV
eukprot:scaffold1661_cov251-Pinguiococcus_pyrenoidosus.AAC.13